MPAAGFNILTDDQVRKLKIIEGNGVGSSVLAQVMDDALTIAAGELPTGIPQANVSGLVAALAAKLTATQATTIAALGSTSNFSALVVAAAGLVAGTPTAAAQGASYDQTALNAALDLKTEQADFAQLVTDMNAALLLKADNVDAETLRTQVEARMDAVEAKIDAVIAALKTAGVMAT